MRQTILLPAFAVMVVLAAVPASAKQKTLAAAPAKDKSPAAATVPLPCRTTCSSKVARTFLPPAPKLVARMEVKKTAKVVAVQPTAPDAGKTVIDPSVVTPAGTPTINGPLPKGALARITAYWTDEDYYTSQHMSSTGVRLHEGHCAVDPSLIPYGSVIKVPGMGSYVAVDTGSAVKSREAAIGAAHNQTERNALVVDLFFENRQEAEQFAAHGPTFVSVSWNKPLTASDTPLNPRALPADGLQETARVQVYVLESAPSLADCRLPLNLRAPTIF